MPDQHLKYSSASKAPVSGRKRWIFLVLLVLLLALYQVFQGHSDETKSGHASGHKGPVPVAVTSAQLQTVPLQVETIGTVESLSSVFVKPQIEGQVASVHFVEGQQVRAGDLLFTLDPRPYQAALAQAQGIINKDQALISQAQANVARDQAQVRLSQAAQNKDQAQLAYSQAEEARYASLLQQDFISREQYEQVLTNRNTQQHTINADQAAVQGAQGTVKADFAAVQNAKANLQADQAVSQSNRIRLQYCYIRAPFTGRTGGLQVHPGDAVQPNNTNLVQIQQLTPINVTFSVPEQTLPDIRKYQAQGSLTVEVTPAESESPDQQTKGAQSTNNAVNASATNLTATSSGAPGGTPDLAGGQSGALAAAQAISAWRLPGHLFFIDNTVDPATGTIKLKGRFENRTGQLWPGQFVHVILTLARQQNALVVPAQAVQTGQQGPYVYVAHEGKALYRPVSVSRTVNGLTVISSGLRPGEQVVSDGQFLLAPNSAIRVKSGPVRTSP